LFLVTNVITSGTEIDSIPFWLVVTFIGWFKT
jgi:hypothetical protein